MSSRMKDIHKSVWFWVAVTATLVVFVLGYQLVSRLRGGDGIGAYARSATLTDSEGNIVNLDAVIGTKPVVLVFYHANWCPYCHSQFSELSEVQDEFEKLCPNAEFI